MKNLCKGAFLGVLISLFICNTAVAQNIRIQNNKEIKALGVIGDSKALGYITIEGTKQGKFKGDDSGLPQKSEFFDYSYTISAPVDPVSGLATGKTKHGAVTIMKKNGYSTPQCIQALDVNEVLKTVFIEFVKTQSDGTKAVYYTVKLSNARIIRIYQRTDDGESASKQGSQPLDEISFVYKKMEVESIEGNTMAVIDNE